MRDSTVASTSNRHGFKCLADAVAYADELERKIIYVCRCPYCAELLILPARPVAVSLPLIETDEP